MSGLSFRFTTDEDTLKTVLLRIREEKLIGVNSGPATEERQMHLWPLIDEDSSYTHGNSQLFFFPDGTDLEFLKIRKTKNDYIGEFYMFGNSTYAPPKINLSWHKKKDASVFDGEISVDKSKFMKDCSTMYASDKFISIYNELRKILKKTTDKHKRALKTKK